MIIIKGRVIDGNGGVPVEKGAVVIEDDRIRLVCREADLPEYPDSPEIQVFEVEDGSILPGLIDAHVHMGWGSAKAIDWIGSTPQMQTCLALRDMAQLRASGYTAFRDLGSDVVLMRPAAEAGLISVPRIFAAGRILTQIGGHGDPYHKITVEASKAIYNVAYIVNGVDEVREACRRNARNGADLIKIMTTGGVFSNGDKAGEISHFSRDEIRAAVEEAENMGSYVSSHAQANRGIRTALECGVKSIEHGFYLDDYCIDLMVKNGCWYVPTLSIMHTSKVYFETREGVLPYLKEKTLRSYEAHYRAVEKARRAGVKIGMGCDFLGDAEFGCSYDKATMEFERMAAAGFTPLEIIRMATKINSELLLMSDRRGTLEEGKLADVILVKGDMSASVTPITDAENVKLVVQDGKIVKNIM